MEQDPFISSWLIFQACFVYVNEKCVCLWYRLKIDCGWNPHIVSVCFESHSKEFHVCYSFIWPGVRRDDHRGYTNQFCEGIVCQL